MFVYKMVDMCAVEFELYMFYFYSMYEMENESNVLKKFFVLVLGFGFICIG